MDRLEVIALYNSLHQGIAPADYTKERPLLAHYTSVQSAELILKSEELWLSNPLFMNDLEELRFGIYEGARLFPQFALSAAGGRGDRAGRIVQLFNHYLGHWQENSAFDTYVFCLSEHDPRNTDGILSMWRGYGAHGNGAALVFNTAKIPQPVQAPFVIAKLTYATRDRRRNTLGQGLSEWARITKEADLPDDALTAAAYAAFDFLKGSAITTKHVGFSEEQEWRIIYVPEYDRQGLLKGQLDYTIGQRGVEPKLKYKVAPVFDVPGERISLSGVLEFIILGPTISSPLAKRAFCRMLDRIGKGQFSDRVYSSEIPLRPAP
jgi:DUF2971 family protein